VLTSLLALLWMCAGVLLVPAVVSLLEVRRHAHAAPAADTTRRTRLALAATLVALAALGVAAVLGAAPAEGVVTAAVLAGSVLAWAPRRPTWAVRGVVSWGLLTGGVVGFVAWAVARIVTSSLSTWQLLLASLAWVLLVLALVRLGLPARDWVAGHAETRAGAPTPPLAWERHLVPLAAVVAAGAVAIGVTYLGGSEEVTRLGPRPSGTTMPPSAGATSSTTSGPESSVLPETAGAGSEEASTGGPTTRGPTNEATRRAPGQPPPTVAATAAAAGLGPAVEDGPTTGDRRTAGAAAVREWRDATRAARPTRPAQPDRERVPTTGPRSPQAQRPPDRANPATWARPAPDAPADPREPVAPWPPRPPRPPHGPDQAGLPPAHQRPGWIPGDGLPPGLAGRDHTPPWWVRHGSLPPGLAGR
jgi:hypothetical protein